MKILIVGSGVGGLACGIRLAARGFDVTILEKNEKVGGRCDHYEQDGFKFDTGPTLLMMKDTLEQLFSEVGRRLEDYLPIERVQPAYRITYSDGKTLDFTDEESVFAKELERFGESLERYKDYVALYQDQYRALRDNFVDKPLDQPAKYLTPRALRLLVKTKPWLTVWQVAQKYFKTPYLQMAFAFQTIYLGISPSACPGIYGMLPYIDQVEGVHFPEGGMSRIPEVMAQLFTELGGKIRFGASVEEIQVHSGKVQGVRLADGEEVVANAVVSNVDLVTTYRKLFSKEMPSPNRTKIEKMEKTCSAAVFLWAVDKTYPELNHHNLYLPVDFQKALDDLFVRKQIPESPAFYLCNPCRTDQGMAPEGSSSLMALVPVPNMENPIDWQEKMPALRQQLVSQLEATLTPGLSDAIRFEKTLPPTWYGQRYALADASTFGLMPTFFQSAMFRPQRRSPDVEGLYFAGASTHPGNGVPIVIISGQLAAQAVAEDAGDIPQAPPVVLGEPAVAQAHPVH